VVPAMRQRIDEPRDVRRLRLELGWRRPDQPRPRGRRPEGHRSTIELTDPQTLQAGPADEEAREYLKPEPLIESDAPRDSRGGREGDCGRRRCACARGKADALRQRTPRQEADGQPPVGARGPSYEGWRLQRAHGALCRDGALDRHPRTHRGRSDLRRAHGAFYYHAWPEVYIDEGSGPRLCGCRSTRR
jgi:hypothetical protein